MMPIHPLLFFFFFNDTATTEIYTLSLHDALPIYHALPGRDLLDRDTTESRPRRLLRASPAAGARGVPRLRDIHRSEEHTSELQSLRHLVCRLLLEKKKIVTSCHLTQQEVCSYTLS